MKRFLLAILILCIAPIFTDSLYAQKKDSLVYTESGFDICGGSGIRLNGIFFGAAWNKTIKHFSFRIQYDYYGYDYMKLHSINYYNYLVNAHSISILHGYQFRIHNLRIVPMVGVCAGIGQFEDNPIKTHIPDPNPATLRVYRQSYFIGLNFRLGVDYNITNRLSTGLAFSTHMYDALSTLRTWYGLQVSAGYRFPAKTVRFKPLEKNPLYHRWKVGWTYTCALTGNKGEIGFPYHVPNWAPSFETDEKETARISHQPAIEMISPAVIRNRLAFRLRLGLDRYYYTGSAQGYWIDFAPTPPVCYYNRDRTEYYSKDYFITFSLLPQFNITRGKRYTLYALAGPSIGRILKEDLFKNTDQYFREVKFWAPFGYTGAGATFSIKGKLFLDTQLMFTLQLTTTPDNRRFVSSGLKVGVYL